MGNHLYRIRDRIDSVQLEESSRRKNFLELLELANINGDAKCLSVSTAEGRWDYLVLKNENNIKEIIATDIVDCPVHKEDIDLLNSLAVWKFKKVEAEKKLPFEDNYFDLVYHHDVIEHVEKSFFFVSEQYRVLKKGGYLIVGTPNLLRPANVAKIMLGRLKYPICLTSHDDIGDCVHIQEFTKWQLYNTLKEVGFCEIIFKPSFFGLHFLNIKLSDSPKSSMGSQMCNYLMFLAKK